MSEFYGDAEVFICRDVAGPHVGGPECFCVPHRFGPAELDRLSADQIAQRCADAERKH